MKDFYLYKKRDSIKCELMKHVYAEEYKKLPMLERELLSMEYNDLSMLDKEVISYTVKKL